MSPSKAEPTSHPGNWYVLVYGLPGLREPATLAPGLSLLPIPKQLRVFDLAAIGAAGFREWAALDPIIHGCVCEIESAADSAVPPGLDALNRAWLASALLVLRGFSTAKCVAASAYRWQDVPIPDSDRARMDLPPFRGGLLDLHFRMLRVEEPPHEVSSSCLGWLAQALPTADRLLVSNPSFYLALQAAADWRFAADKRSAIARLWCGIEALFGVSSELVFRISLLAASLLEDRGETRLERFKEVKRLYGQRSKAVHGDKLSEEQLDAALRGSFALLRELLTLVIDRGRTFSQEDFDEAVFL